MRARHVIRARGTVQGVGFRPAVFRIAEASGLAGFVRNDGEGVWIEVEGELSAVSAFPESLRAQAPAQARIETLQIHSVPPTLESGFRVDASSREGEGSAAIPVDLATCDACLNELFDSQNRRYRYPFINCTDCGPRFTIVRETPYDRARTTMSRFVLCGHCRAEYEDPRSRRFHAEATACAQCGPLLHFANNGQPSELGEAALFSAVRALEEGRIVAVMGLGGFFLAVDARNEWAVARLRKRKRRADKPLALMARDLVEASAIAQVDPFSQEMLCSSRRPIVLLPARRDAALAPSVAPRLDELGVMLPYTPLHHLLLHEGPSVLVLTSGNFSDEPIARTTDEAFRTLGEIADAFLVHDREIHTRADDSVLRANGGKAQLVRRARGYVPERLPLGFASRPVLAVGAELKNTVCLAASGEAVLSQHIGDLETPEAFAFFSEVIEKLQRLTGVRPEVVAHDLHPDAFSTRWARSRGLTTVPVQHHHAHIASCLAEHGRRERVIGVAFDGTGYGPDGTLWGGEFLLADLGGFRRFAHLSPLSLPGGEAAIREPWRLALAALVSAGIPVPELSQVSTERQRLLLQLLRRPALCPVSTSAGRWFDAFAGLCGLRDRITYEGQAAIELEATAAQLEASAFPFAVETRERAPACVDLRPAVRAATQMLRAGSSAPEIAARFHETLAAVVLDVCRRARAVEGANTVALTGGCFQNRRLSATTHRLLSAEGFEVLVHERVPANDGGLSLGQAAVASWRLGSEEGREDVSRNSR